MSPKEGIMIKGLHHNVYRCRDSEETRRFYEDFLGLPLASARELGSVRALHTFFALGNGSFLAFFEVPDRPFEFKQQDGFDLHIALEVEPAELQGWLEKGWQAGVKMGEIVDHEVVRSLYIHDPNGYVIELTARTAKHDELLQSDPHKRLERWQASKGGPRKESTPLSAAVS
jgi:catechol 2,3-dioxygenase-like lactoylglutathione lyase family enzyme